MEKKMSFKKIGLATAVSLVMAGWVMSPVSSASVVGSSLVASSDHDGGHSSGGGGHSGNKGSGGKHGAGGNGGEGHSSQGMRQGKKSIVDLLSEDEDSDRPPWAGVPGNEGKPGGGNAGGTTKKGGDYGDIVVMLRNDDGTLVEEGNITYAVAADGSLIEVVDGEIPEGADVQAVEFGRLNIARAPSKVLDHSLVEALSKLDGGELYLDENGVLTGTVTLDPSGRLVTADGFTIDSPLENLAIYKALLTASPDSEGNLVLTAESSHDGSSSLYALTIDADLRLDLAASAIAAASDKTGQLTIDEIVGISGFIGVADELAEQVTSYSYDRTTTYDGVTIFAMVGYDTTGDGVIDTYHPEEKALLDEVSWNTVEDNSIKDNVADLGIDQFTQAADDAVQALEYVHDNAVDQ